MTQLALVNSVITVPTPADGTRNDQQLFHKRLQTTESALCEVWESGKVQLQLRTGKLLIKSSNQLSYEIGLKLDLELTQTLRHV